ncbi:hypothetical protein ACTFIY_001524 [Dictyostelium cf. discoideum]
MKNILSKIIILLIVLIFINCCFCSTGNSITPTPTGSPTTNEVVVSIYSDSLNSSFTIVSGSELQEVRTPTHGGSNSSISFTTDFYIFSKTNTIANITINKQLFKSLRIWINPTTLQQDITISLITSDKEIHAIPITNLINPINSVSRLSHLQPNKWTEIDIDLEFFPSIDYRAIWFLQRHPNGSVILDDIGLVVRETPRNRRQIYKGGIQGYGVIISQGKGVKLYQNVKTYKKSPYSIIFNMKKSRAFSIDFQSTIDIQTNNDIDFVFHILSKKKLPTTGGDLMVSFIPIHPLDTVPRFNLTGSKTKSPCQVVSLPENKWIKCAIRIPKLIELRRIQLSYSNSNLSTSYHIFLDNIYFESPVTGDKTLNNPSLSNSLLDSFKNSASFQDTISLSNNKLNQILPSSSPKIVSSQPKIQSKINKKSTTTVTSPTTTTTKPIITNNSQKQGEAKKSIQQLETNNNKKSFKSIKSGEQSILIDDKDFNKSGMKSIVEHLNLNEKKSPKNIEKKITNDEPQPTYFTFDQINPLFVTSIGQTLKWGTGLPDITFKSPNEKSIIKSSTLNYEDDFNSPDFTTPLGKEPVKILSIGGITRNEFKFLNMKFSFPFNNFYLIVSIDPYEEVWISASKPDGTVTNNWNIIKNGFLMNQNNNNNNINNINNLQSQALSSPQTQTQQQVKQVQQQQKQPQSQSQVQQQPKSQPQSQIQQQSNYPAIEFSKGDNINGAIMEAVNGTSNPIKTKIKGDQGFYLKAGKSSDNNPPINFIILKQTDIISGISFSMVSDRKTSSFFYALLANPNDNSTLPTATPTTTTTQK